MNIRNIFMSGIFVLAAIMSVSCENELYRDDKPMLEFESAGYPYVDGYITANEDVAGMEVVLGYRNGCGRTVEMDIENITGIYADMMTVTLEENEGIVKLPLKGVCTIPGIQDFKVRVHYDRTYIFCPFRVGVRPEAIEDIEVVGTPELKGVFLKDIASEAYVSVSYANGWGRSITARFECEDEGISSEEQSFRLNLDGTAGTIDIPVVGKPVAAAEIEARMILSFEDVEEPQDFTFTFDINEPVPYEQEEVKQYLIVTDRNDLDADASSLETREFVYNTVFVDMNGDGYVTDNYEIWLDRNVGATSTDVASEESYGFIYQASRNAPGYMKNSQNGGYWIGEMKSASNFMWYNGSGEDDTSVPDVTVVPGTVGPKNPCPNGFRMPTVAEFNKLIAFLGSSVEAYTGAPLNFPLPGEYNGNKAASKTNAGVWGVYWGAPAANGGIMSLELNSTADTAKMMNRTKGSGCSIRCVKAKPEEIMEYSYSANPATLITPAE